MDAHDTPSQSDPDFGDDQASQLETSRASLTVAMNRIQTLNIFRGRLEAALETANLDAQRIAGELESAQLRGEEMNTALTENEGKLKTARDQIARLMDSLSEARVEIARHAEIGETQRVKLEGAWSRMQSDTERVRALQAQLESERQKANALREQLDRVTSSRAWRQIARYRRVRNRLAGHTDGRPATQKPTTATRDDVRPMGQDETPAPSQLDVINGQLAEWLARVRAAPGSSVVFMFSGTTHVQERRANRPIRLTRVYLKRGDPVFFNYYRWNQDDPLAHSEDPLLLQSPIDLTADLIEGLLDADVGSKRKVMFASFPHELMVRSLARAQQKGWTVIYDARDDWEEFSKVGAADWYDLGFERYVARQADIVTAVSWPLARKIETMSDREVAVNANAADPDFPLPSHPRNPSSPPVFGYFGHLTDKWFDWQLVRAAADRYPKWQFELAGHQAPFNLDLPDNVHLLGLLSHAELAELSTGWTAGIIPFKTGSLADGVDPIKVYEYLQLGLPVLATYFPQMRNYPGVLMAHSHDDFVDKLGRMPQVNFEADEIRAYVGKNTWNDRVAAYDLAVDAIGSADSTRDGRRLLRAPTR